MKAQVAGVQEKLDQIAAQQERVLAQLRYVIDASERLGKKDWIMTAMGVFSSMAVSAVIPPELARELWFAFVQAISNVAMVRQLPGNP